jgi:hypothetical protein
MVKRGTDIQLLAGAPAKTFFSTPFCGILLGSELPLA